MLNNNCFVYLEVEVILALLHIWSTLVEWQKYSLTVLLCSISEGLFRYSSSGEIFEQPKPDYEEALKKCGYKEKLCKTSRL